MLYSQIYVLSINKKNGKGLYTSNVVNMDSAGAVMGEQAEMKLITHEASEETSSQSPLGISICLSTHYPYSICYHLPTASSSNDCSFCVLQMCLLPLLPVPSFLLLLIDLCLCSQDYLQVGILSPSLMQGCEVFLLLLSVCNNYFPLLSMICQLNVQ